ncbi:MAG: hypothetical protein QFF03_11000 [Pseudomonadota bacterium]|nr:hypothetical protein [Pseudomonadota bacterium]
MNGTIQAMPIDDVAAGMVLAEALRDPGGAVLLPAGATLTDANLNALRRRGIAALDVVGSADADSNAESDAYSALAREAERERQCARLARLFRNSATAGANGDLLARLLRYRTKE